MTKPITTLAQDINNRWARSLVVAGLTTTALVLFMLGNSWWTTVLQVLCVAAIIGVISTDAARGLNHSKTALYATVIALTLWLVTFVEAFLHPPHTLFSLSVGDESTVFSIVIAPIVLVSFLLLLLAMGGSIAYTIGRKRGDIRGTKKQKIFR